MTDKPTVAVKRERADEIAAALRQEYASVPPPGPTADAYRLAGYVDGLVGAARPECNVLLPHFDSGLKWPDKNNPLPDDPLWGGGVRAGVRWDGTFYRDLVRYPAGGANFWSAYLKPGSAPGNGNGYWLNFGSGWAHLCNDDPAQINAGASPRLYFDLVLQQWTLVIEATLFVTLAVVDVWTGVKVGGTDPVGIYTRVSGCDPVATLRVES
jgi:hypothetical protein